MSRPFALTVALVCTLLLTACSPSSERTYPVGGRAVAGPVCPVERTPPDPACRPRPVAGATLVITAADGGEVARTTTDVDGGWTVTLRAGAYTLTPQPVVGLLGTAPPIQFTISATGSSVGLDVTYDTGIR